MATARERSLRNALKFGTAGEVDSKEGFTIPEGLMLAPPNRSEVGAPQGEVNGTLGEAIIKQPQLQCLPTKLIFDVRIDHPFLD